MKSVILSLLFFIVCICNATSQIPDTMYTKSGAVSNDRKVVITKTTEIGSKKIQEISVMDSVSIKTEISKLEQDTSQFRQYLVILANQREALQVETQRIRKMNREAIRQLTLFKNTLTSIRNK